MMKPFALAAATGVLSGLVYLGAQGPGAPAAPTDADRMYAAIRTGNAASVDALLSGGMDVNVRERRGGITPLMNAAAFGSLDVMRLLLDRGADVNARSAAGATALMWGATDLAKVRLLLDRGADVTVAAESGRTALFLAAMSDESAEIVRLLLARGADPKKADAGAVTTLWAATFGNDTGTIRQLVSRGVDVNAADAMLGASPLHNAASNGNVDAVRTLLAAGARANAVSGPPSQQVKNGTIALGRFTPLILAAPFGSPDVVRTLLDAGADVNAQDARGMTALVTAAGSDHADLETVRLLLARGADVNVKDTAGETAADWARKSGTTRVLQAIERAGGKTTPMPAHPLPPATPAATARAAVERSVPLMERTSGSFFERGACGACHAQNAADLAVGAARTSGVPINQAAATGRAAGAAAAFGATATRLLERFDGPAVDILLYTLAGLAAVDYAPDRATDAMVFNVAAQQWRDGRWHMGGVARPPIEDGDFSRTALGIRTLKMYGPPGRGAEMTARTARATAWLRTARPLSTEDHAFRLLGLTWGGAAESDRRAAAAALSALQRPAGGWGQRTEMAADAYATGLALYALLQTGSISPRDAAAQRGVAYLLANQRADGSWYVRSRAAKFQPYFESGFPYAHDQWISSMATGWATAALASSLREGTLASRE